MNTFKKASITYVVANFSRAIIPFILIPILTRYLSQEEYGQIGMFQAFFSVISAMMLMGTPILGARKLYDENFDEHALSKFNGSGVHLVGISAIFFMCIFHLFGSYIVEYFSLPIKWIYFSVLLSISLFIFHLRLSNWQFRHEPLKYGFLSLFQALCILVLSLVFIVVFSLGVEGWIYAQLLAGLVVLITAYISLLHDKLISIRFWNKLYLKEYLSYSLPLLPHIVGVVLLSFFDRIILNQKMGLSNVGIYVVAVQVSMILAILFDAINKAYTPWLFENLKKRDELDKILLVKNTYIYFLIIIAGTVFYVTIVPFFVFLLAGETYQEAGKIAILLCIGQLFHGMYLAVTNYIFFTKKTSFLSLGTVSSVVIHLCLLLLLIELYGLIGAAIAFVFSKLCQFLITWYMSNKCFHMPWMFFLKQNA